MPVSGRARCTAHAIRVAQPAASAANMADARLVGQVIGLNLHA
ncbi:hypothetical protein SAJA_00820 [Salinisphaera japonica YTM-1]|uniref:Uncharacterized protein n=1 Tax=Salinisphaera japonica YTM-1 TaxID=1209778 RepID=A0A423Q2P9_9GAMM|nr:hypothetical protein SAJA_00820 [Salinisphaera japonica YTM-1]